MRLNRLILLAPCVFTNAFAHEVNLESIIVEGRRTNLIGEAVSAAEGVVGQDEIRVRPLTRTGDVLELIPGMVVTQHSGSGKANQYFLRGFNLDHGTDFATNLDGMPVNMRSHGHGQGYTDLSFIIPETIGKLSYRKGAYYAEFGDFSGAGGVNISTLKQTDSAQLSLGIGDYGYQRALFLAPFQSKNGDTLVALERQEYDGPWQDIKEDIGKTNALAKFTMPLAQGELSLTAMGYRNSWNSADQIPARAVTQGLISRLGSLDTSVGGESSRYSINAQLQHGAWSLGAYAISYDLNLWSNFTYFLDDETAGDQFEQVDDRAIYGGHLTYSTSNTLFGKAAYHSAGLQHRTDDIDDVGLFHTQARKRLGVTRQDAITQHSTALFLETEIDWQPNLRSVMSARVDYFDFKVTDRAGINRFGVDLSANSGTSNDAITSLKGSLVYQLSPHWESYLSAGQGFHSNDARGTTITLDPTSGEAISPVDPLVRSSGYEVGIRGLVGEKVQLSTSLWSLSSDSELLFVGDAGNTEASNPSKRQGIEFVAYYFFNPHISADFEYAYTDAKFKHTPAGEDAIPGAVKDVLQAGINVDFGNAWYGSVRYRYFGKRPLNEDNSVEADSLQAMNLRLGYRQQQWQIHLDVLNLTDSKDNDIAYFYESRLAMEPSGQGQEDVHFHPLASRSVRLSVSYTW